MAFAVCFGSILLLRPVASNWGLVDSPNNRKQHIGEIPLIGGIAVYLSVLITVGTFVDRSDTINFILISISLMVLVGALDDKYDISAKLRLVAQILIASILVFAAGIEIHSFGNLFGYGEISTGSMSKVITILAIVAGINAFNMTDGIDGLAASLSLLSLAFLYVLVGERSVQVFIGIVSAALLMFLMFNLELFSKKRKIFLGDSGSMMMGLLVSWLLIESSQGKSVTIPPGHVLWFVAVPLIDMVAVMYRRLRKGQSPLVADREHLHHVFMDVGLNSKQALALISVIAILFSSFGLLLVLMKVSELFGLIIFVLVFLIYNVLLTNRRKFRKIFK